MTAGRGSEAASSANRDNACSCRCCWKRAPSDTQTLLKTDNSLSQSVWALRCSSCIHLKTRRCCQHFTLATRSFLSDCEHLLPKKLRPDINGPSLTDRCSVGVSHGALLFFLPVLCGCFLFTSSVLCIFSPYMHCIFFSHCLELLIRFFVNVEGSITDSLHFKQLEIFLYVNSKKKKLALLRFCFWTHIL